MLHFTALTGAGYMGYIKYLYIHLDEERVKSCKMGMLSTVNWFPLLCLTSIFYVALVFTTRPHGTNVKIENNVNKHC